MIRVGTAAWGLPRAVAGRFGAGGSNLVRYATRFDAVEINTTFYRPHRRATFERWADSVPDGFRFAAKLPRTITHEARLVDCDAALAGFLEGVRGLRDRLGPLLVQLPPSLGFDEAVAKPFFAGFRALHPGPIACEPRHPTWFGLDAEALLKAFTVARVAADPPPIPAAAFPGGWPGLRYHRLHGAPRIYWSAYTPGTLDTLADTLCAGAADAETWCILDNTAAGAATADALAVTERLRGRAGFGIRRGVPT